MTTNERDETIREIRENLKRRSGRAWSVKGGRGSVWGWITITAPPARLVDGFNMSTEDRETLSALLGETVHQAVQIPASGDYRAEYVARAKGEPVTVVGTPYWD
jgi:hypothetical protein